MAKQNNNTDKHPCEDFFEEYDGHPDKKPLYSVGRGNIYLLFCGFEIVLMKDGTYFLEDTTGG
jgi:hypothetical protein